MAQVSHHIPAVGGVPVPESIVLGMLLGGIHGRLGGIQADHMWASPFQRSEAEAPGIAEGIEDLPACRHVHKEFPVVALVEKETGFLPI